MDPLIAAELRRTRNALSSVISRPVVPTKHAGAGWKDVVRQMGDPADVADGHSSSLYIACLQLNISRRIE